MAPLAHLLEPAVLACASGKHSPRATCRRRCLPIKGNRPGTTLSPHNRRDTRYRPGRTAPPVPGLCSRSTGRPLRSSTGCAGHDLQSRPHRSYGRAVLYRIGGRIESLGILLSIWRSKFGLSLFDLSHNFPRLTVSWLTLASARDACHQHRCARAVKHAREGRNCGSYDCVWSAEFGQNERAVPRGRVRGGCGLRAEKSPPKELVASEALVPKTREQSGGQ